MKIVHIIIGLDTGGAELMLTRLVEHQRQNTANEHIVISLTTYGSLTVQLQEQGVLVFALGLSSFSGLLLSPFRLFKMLRKIKPDIVQCWMYHSDFLGGLMARLAGIKIVIWGIRTTDISYKKGRLTKVIRYCCARLSRYVPSRIVCAARASMEFHGDLGYDRSKMMVIPNGFEEDKFKFSLEHRDTIRKHYKVAADELLVGTVGRFDPVKNFYGLIQAARMVCHTHSNTKFLLVGRGLDANNDKLHAWLDECGIRSRFILLGERKDIHRIYSAMDIYCMPSITEGFPNCLGEAMCCGLPSVATNVGDACYMQGESGLCVDSPRPEDIANKLIDLISLAGKERRAMGERARSIILSRFSNHHSCSLYQDEYEKLFASRHR